MKPITRIIYSLLFISLVLALFPTMQVKAANRARVTINSVNIPDNSITPGEEADIAIEFLNPTETCPAYNILATVTFDNDMIYPADGKANQLYIERLGGGDTAIVHMKIKARETVEDFSGNALDMIGCNVYITYADDYFQEIDASAKFFINIANDSRLKVVNISVPEEAQINTKTRVSASYSNGGKSTIKNVILHVDGVDGKTSELELGDINGGESNFAEHYVEFQEEGMQNVSVYITYTNSSDELITVGEKASVIDIKPMKTVSTEVEKPEENNSGINVINLVVSAIAVLIISIFGISRFVKWINKRR